MKVYFLGMIMSGVPLVEVEEIKNLTKSFETEVGGMAFVDAQLDKMHGKKMDASIIREVWNDVEAAINNADPATVYALNEIRNSILQQSYGNPKTMTDIQLIEVRPVIMKEMRYKRQLYWLAWLENFYCIKILNAIQSIRAKIDKSPENLIVAALSEFSLMDIPVLAGRNVGIYKTIIDKFLDGKLPGLPCRDGMRRMLSFCELTRGYSKGKCRLMIVPGTILWKEQTVHAIYHNTAPVFWSGACIHVWDKQLISSEDGICCVSKRKHPEPIAGAPAIPSVLTQEFLTSRHRDITEITPVFKIALFDKEISFGLSICLDASRPDFFPPQSFVDIQLYLACGGSLYAMLTEEPVRVKASRAVFYFDAKTSDACVFNPPLYCIAWAYDLKAGKPKTISSYQSKLKKLICAAPEIYSKCQKELVMYVCPEVIDI